MQSAIVQFDWVLLHKKKLKKNKIKILISSCIKMTFNGVMDLLGIINGIVIMCEASLKDEISC